MAMLNASEDYTKNVKEVEIQVGRFQYPEETENEDNDDAVGVENGGLPMNEEINPDNNQDGRDEGAEGNDGEENNEQPLNDNPDNNS